MGFNLERLIKKYTDEGGRIDYEGVMGEIDNNYVNPIVARNKPDTEELYAQVARDFLNDLGIDNVNDLESFEYFIDNATRGQEELARENQELMAALQELDEAYQELGEEYETVQGGLEYDSYAKQLKEAGFNDKYVEIALKHMYDLPENEFPTFDLALDHVREQYPEWMAQSQQPQTKSLGGSTPRTSEPAVSDAEIASMRKLAGLE
jgi:hypothetical protein